MAVRTKQLQQNSYHFKIFVYIDFTFVGRCEIFINECNYFDVVMKRLVRVLSICEHSVKITKPGALMELGYSYQVLSFQQSKLQAVPMTCYQMHCAFESLVIIKLIVDLFHD